MQVSVTFEADPASFDFARFAELFGLSGAKPSRSADARVRRRLSGRAPSGSRLREAEYRRPLLEALAEMGGSGSRAEVTKAVYPKIKDKLTEIDKGKNPSGGIRWRNRVAWVRAHLVEEGALKKNSPRGTWELSGKGWKEILEDRPDLAG